LCNIYKSERVGTNQLPSIKTPYVKRDESFKISYRDIEVDSIDYRWVGGREAYYKRRAESTEKCVLATLYC